MAHGNEPSGARSAALTKKARYTKRLGMAEESMRNPALIAIKAVNGEKLTAQERQDLTPALLAQLAAGDILSLTRQERDRLSPALLGQLAIGRSVELEADELKRLPEGLRFIVEEALRNSNG
jgi:beta-lactamase class A